MRIGDRPWGPLLGDLGVRGFSGKLSIDAADKQLSITYQRGAIVDAFSPLPSDSPLRAALTGHFIAPTVVSAISRRIAASPGKDEITVIAEAAKLSTEHVRRLRARVVLARATRTFAIEDGEVVIEESPLAASSAMPVCALDVRAVVHQGARMHLSELRLAAELRQLGGVFTLRPDAPLAAYEISDAEQPVIAALRGGITLAELEMNHRDIDPRAIQVVVYTLVSCGAARGNGAAQPAPVMTRTPTPRTVTPPPAEAPATPVVARTPTPQQPPAVARTTTPSTPAPPRTTTPRVGSGLSSPAVSRTVTPRMTASDLATLVATRTQLIDTGSDFFAILGLATEAPPEAVRVAHLRLAALLQPPHLALVGYDDATGGAKRLLEHVETAFHVLNDPARRTAYVAAMSRTNDGALRAARARTYEEVAERTPAAEAFHRGQLALRADLPAKAAIDFAAAVELEPHSFEYQTMLAWAKFCAAADRDAIAMDTRKTLERIVNRADQPENARYYLGRVERLLGREREALRHFREVLAVAPHHAEAASEVRVLESRLAANR